MFHYSPNSFPCFLPLLTDCHILIKAMHCKGKVLQGALFQQAQYRAARWPHPSLHLRGSLLFWDSGWVLPTWWGRKSTTATSWMQAEWSTIQNRRAAACPQVSELSGSILCPILLISLESLCLSIFLHSFSPFLHRYINPASVSPITLVEEKVQRMVRGLP